MSHYTGREPALHRHRPAPGASVRVEWSLASAGLISIHRTTHRLLGAAVAATRRRMCGRACTILLGNDPPVRSDSARMASRSGFPGTSPRSVELGGDGGGAVSSRAARILSSWAAVSLVIGVVEVVEHQ